jgi:hypothetical protein
MNHWLSADLRSDLMFLSTALRDHEKKEENLSMKKSVLPGATEEDTHMAVRSSNSSTRVRPDRNSPPSTPRWVKVSVIIFIVLVLLFVIMHLTGNGFGDHMHMSTIEHGVQQL